MKHLLIIYSVVFFLLLWGKASHADVADIDFETLRPADQVADELKQNETLKNKIDNKGFWFRHHYPWVYPPPPYFYPVPYRAPVVTCYASDAYGYTWSAASYVPFEAQNMALQSCFVYSNRGCYSRGCSY